ncbi:MAG: helix-turn-helix transcriptional regulator [Myroides sp.]
MSYELSQQLKSDGFSINTLAAVIHRNNGRRSFNTMEYYCIYIVFTNTTVVVEDVEYDIEGPALAFIGPSTNILYKQSAEEDSNYVVAFSSAFYDRSASDSLFLNSELFYNDSQKIFIAPTIATAYDIKKFAVDRLALYESAEKGLYVSIAHNTIEALILSGMLYISKSSVGNTADNFSHIDKVNKFRVLMNKDYRLNKTVKYYADQLHVTPRRLTEMTEKVSGKTPKQLITEKVVQESLRLLRHSKFTITQIAYEMEFNDEANFSNFIKKNLGQTPRELRAKTGVLKNRQN